jgi:hypothetical protein
MRRIHELVFGVLLLTAAGCTITSSAMRPVDPSHAINVPAAGEAVVIFMRPSRVGGAIQSSVFDVTQPSNRSDKLVGIVSAGTKVAYATVPGEHLFMVIGENADFMAARLAAGKTYYVLVTPRMGWWKSRFSLVPIHKTELNGGDFTEWRDDTTLVENTEESAQWAQANWASIQDKKVDYLRKWNGKPQSERDEQTLYAEDGQ